MFKWISGIIAAVIAGVAVWYLTKPPPDPLQPPKLTFLEKLNGQYTLRAWNEENRPVTMAVVRGELRIDPSGNADWELDHMGFWSPSSRPACRKPFSHQVWRFRDQFVTATALGTGGATKCVG